jgi:hypothetical protein
MGTLGFRTPETIKAEVIKKEDQRMFSETKRGFKAQVVKQFIGIMVVIIIGVAVVLPVIQNVSDTAGLSGITGTIVSYLSTFVAIALLLVVTGLF